MHAINLTTPYWLEQRKVPRYKPLAENLEVDVLIIGGGITGVTAAWLLAKEGRSVALVERDGVGGCYTSHTTAHLTWMTDTRLSDLITTFSREEAKTAWKAGQAAMQCIERAVADVSIDCELMKVPGYLAAAHGKDLKRESAQLREEAAHARRMGFAAEYIDADPVTHQPAIRFAEQMQFHPLRYVDALADAATQSGARIFAHTEVTEFSNQDCVQAGGYTIRYEKVFIATHIPLQGAVSSLGAALFQTKLAPYTTYALAAEVKAGTLPPLIWSDSGDPFLYLRTQPTQRGLLCIFGGEDHKTGQEDSAASRYQALQRQIARLIPDAKITHRWSGQVVETVDGLPFIGPTSATQFIATGFSGNGTTFGTLAALMFCDWLQGQSKPWTRLLDPSRRTFSALGECIRENIDYPLHMVTDRLQVEQGTPDSLLPGEAKILTCKGQWVAAYRNSDGHLTVRSAVCPHMGCIVAWNDAERTWDCPCHGSRFKVTGEVIAGPAESALKSLRD